MFLTHLGSFYKILSFHSDEYSEFFSGDQPHENSIAMQCFGDCFCLYHQGWWLPKKTSLHLGGFSLRNFPKLIFRKSKIVFYWPGGMEASVHTSFWTFEPCHMGFLCPLKVNY
jgi:hypothetical protein